MQQPLRTVLAVGEKSFFGVMPAFVPALPALGTKMVTVFAANAERGLPTHLATITLLDPETGALLAILDGRYITEARTAAVSAVSVKHLARERCRNARDHRLGRPGAQPSRSDRTSASRCVKCASGAVPPSIARPSHPKCHPTQGAGSLRPTAPSEAVAGRGPHRPGDGVPRAGIALRMGSRTARTSAPSARAGRTSARWMPRWSRERDSMSTRARGRSPRQGTSCWRSPTGPSMRRTSRVSWEKSLPAAVPGRLRASDVTIFKSLGMAVEDVGAAHLAFERAKRARRGKKL